MTTWAQHYTARRNLAQRHIIPANVSVARRSLTPCRAIIVAPCRAIIVYSGA